MTPLILALPGGGETMLAAVRLLRGAGFARPVIVAVHAVLAEDAAETNRIDLTGAIRRAVAQQLQLDVRHALTPSGER